MTKTQKENILSDIRKGKIQEAINYLHSLPVSLIYKQEADGIAAQWSQLQREKMQGILSNEQAQLTQNRITTCLINLLDACDQQKEVRLKLSNTVSPQPNFFWKNKNIQLIGLIGSLASIIGLLFIFFPTSDNEILQLTVFVTDTKGNVALENEGELNIPLGNRILNAPIERKGRTNFGDIPYKLKGMPITVGLDAEGWEIVSGKNTFIFTGEPIHLKVKRDNSLGIIKGIVKSRDGQEFIEGALVQINTDTSIFSNAQGVFQIVLPEQMQIQKETDTYLLTVSKQSYKTKTEYYSPRSSDAEIRLKKQ